MSDTRISQLPSPPSSLSGTEIMPIVQNGVTYAVPLQLIANLFARSYAASGANDDITALNALSSVPTVVAAAITAAPLVRATAPLNYSGTGAIASSDMNKPLVCYPAVPITLTLPTGTAAGQSISITNNSTTAGAFITLAGPGSQRLYFQGLFNQASIVLGLGDSVTLVFDGSTSWVQQSGASQFGIGQTIQNGTTSTSAPTAGSIYTNTTGKTIYVWVTSPVNALSASTYQFSVNTGGGMTIVDSKVVGQFGSAVTSQMTVGGPVPPGASYMAGAVAGGVFYWRELR